MIKKKKKNLPVFDNYRPVYKKNNNKIKLPTNF